MIFTAFDFPAVVREEMISARGLKSGDNALGHEIPGFMGGNIDHMSFARSLESSLDGMFSKRDGSSGEEIAENGNADVTAINEPVSGNADNMLDLLVEPARTAATPDEIQFGGRPGGTSASGSGGMIGEILSKILKSPDPENPGLKGVNGKNTNGKIPFAMDHRYAPGSHHGNDTLQALVEKFGQGASNPLAVEDGKTQDQLRHLIASLSKSVENSESQMIRHAGKPITNGSDLRQAEMTGNDSRIPVPLDENRDSLKERTAAASEKADEQLRGFLNSLAREATPRDQGSGDSRDRSGSKTSGFKGASSNLAREQSVLNNIASVGTGGVSSLGKGGAASLMEFNLQSTLSDGTGERSGEKPVAFPLDTARPGASFEKSLQQPVENKIMGQVFMRLFSGARQGSGNMTINIYPPELGTVKIRIISDNGRLTVHMHPGNQQVAGILEKNLGVLQQSLADQGLDVSDLFVSVDTGEQERSDFEQQALMQGTGKKGARSGGKDSHEDQNPSPPASHDPWLADGHTLSLRV